MGVLSQYAGRIIQLGKLLEMLDTEEAELEMIGHRQAIKD